MVGENGFPETPDWRDPRTVATLPSNLRKCCSISTFDLVCECCGNWTHLPTLGSE